MYTRTGAKKGWMNGHTVSIYSYFEKGCRKKCTRQSERYCGWFWVLCSLKKFERMAREAMDVCLRMLKESNNRRFNSYSVSRLSKKSFVGTAYWSYPILPFGIVACTFFPTTFLEIAVYQSTIKSFGTYKCFPKTRASQEVYFSLVMLDAGLPPVSSFHESSAGT